MATVAAWLVVAAVVVLCAAVFGLRYTSLAIEALIRKVDAVELAARRTGDDWELEGVDYETEEAYLAARRLSDAQDRDRIRKKYEDLFQEGE